MANNTQNYNLVKPLVTENYDIGVQNGNMDIIDAELAKRIGKTTAAMTLYVRTDGNDANDGSANNSANAIKTIQSAIDRLPKYLTANVNIEVEAGTYAENVIIQGFVGHGGVYLNGDTIISTSRTVNKIQARDCERVYIRGFNLVSTIDHLALAYNVRYCAFSYMNIVQPNTTVDGILTVVGHTAITNCTISNTAKGIAAWSGGRVFSGDNNGTGNVVGIFTQQGGQISKIGTQPAGTTQEQVVTGGLVYGEELTVTITSGFAAGWSGKIVIKKSFDNLVFVDIQLSKSTDILSTETIYTLPTGTIPTDQINQLTNFLNSSYASLASSFGLITIGTNGIIEISAVTGTTLTNARRVHCVSFMYYSA